MNSKMIAIILRGDHISFAIEEAISVFDAEPIETFDRVAVFDTDAIPEKLRYAAFTKEAFEVIAYEKTASKLYESTSHKQMPEYIFPNQSFKIDSRTVGPSSVDTDIGLLAGFVSQVNSCYVNLDEPDTMFCHLKGTQHIFGRRVWERTENFNERRPDRLPAPHPTGISPFIARALVNISKAEDELLDPFCGAGGFLIEAGLCGLEATGIDIDSRMEKRAKMNVQERAPNVTIEHGDGFDVAYTGQTIVTDIPYGRNSYSEQSASSFLDRFVEKTVEDGAKRVCVVYPLSADTVDVMSQIETKDFDFDVNNSLTRRISIYEPL